MTRYDKPAAPAHDRGHERPQAPPGTQRGHIRACKRFAAFLKRSPDTATADDVRRFQLHLIESGASIYNRNRIMTGVQVPVPDDAAAARSGRRDLSPQRAAEGRR